MRIFERETYNEIIENLIENNMEVNEQTKKELDEAGLVDGASRLQILTKIILPVALPGIFSTIILYTYRPTPGVTQGAEPCPHKAPQSP